MITVLTFIKCEISKGIINPNHWNNVDAILDVKIHEAIMTFDREVWKIKFAFYSLFIVLEIKHVNPSFSIFYAVEDGKLRSGDETLHLYRVITFFLSFFKVGLVYLDYKVSLEDGSPRNLLQAGREKLNIRKVPDLCWLIELSHLITVHDRSKHALDLCIGIIHWDILIKEEV